MVGLATAAALTASVADARVSVVYDVLDARIALRDAGLTHARGVWEQHPATAAYPRAAQVVKVTGRSGTVDTPSLAGLDGAQIADVLRERIHTAGGHAVFVDELAVEFRGPMGDRLADALAILQAEPSPYGGANMADRVHIYVPPPPDMIGRPDVWAGAWRALARAGGVWVEAYQGTLASGALATWPDNAWMAWPRAFRAQFVASGGDPTRLHLVLTRGDQAAQWRWARTGPACEYLANGPGAYRVGAADAPAFVAEFTSTFGSDPAVDGPATITCLPSPLLADDARGRLLAALAARNGVSPAPGAALPPLWVGRATRVTVPLGPDPGGIATALGVDPAGFWAAAGATVTMQNGGTVTSGVVRSDGIADLAVTPLAAGPVVISLRVPGSALTRAVSGAPFDLTGTLAGDAAGLGDLYRQMVVFPDTWSLSVPVRAPAGQPAPTAVTPPSEQSATTVEVRAVTPAERAQWGAGYGAGWDGYVVTARDRAGTAVPDALVRVAVPWMSARQMRSDTTGRVVVFTPRRGGSLEVQSVASGATGGAPVAGRVPATVRPRAVRMGAAGMRAARAHPRVAAGFVVRLATPRGDVGGRVGLRLYVPGHRPRRITTDRNGQAQVIVRRTAVPTARITVDGWPRRWPLVAAARPTR